MIPDAVTTRAASRAGIGVEPSTPGSAQGPDRSGITHLALQAAAAGRAVVPLQGKVPLTAHGVHDASRDPSKVTAMFNAAPDATGYGIAAGAASGRAMVDVDGPEALAEAERLGFTSGYVVKTGRPEGGYHLYFSIPEGVAVKSRTLAPGLELKAEGCYVVGPGSRHPSGAYYRVVRDGEPSSAPAWLLEPPEALRGQAIPPREGQAHGLSAAVRIDAAGPPIPEGGRNLELTRVAGRLHDGRDLEGLVRDLSAVNDARCSPPVPEEEVTKIAASIYRRTPCNPAPAVTPRVLAAVERLEAIERPIRGIAGASGWSIYRAGLAALRELGREHPEGVTLSMDVRTWAQRAGTGRATVSRFIRRSPLVRVIRRGSGRKSGAVLFVVPSEANAREAIGHKVGHSSTRGVTKEHTTPASVSPSALSRTLERLRWGPGRIGKSRAALLASVVECSGVMTRSEIAASLGRKPESLRAPLRWLVDAGLLERVGHGVYALPADFARRVEDAREAGREPEADRLQIARHERERDGWRRRNEPRADRGPTSREMREQRESYPERRRAAIGRAIARLFGERPEYRGRRVGQITARLVHYIGPDFPRGTLGAPKDLEVSAILDGVVVGAA
jgi:hypothetical protein